MCVCACKKAGICVNVCMLCALTCVPVHAYACSEYVYACVQVCMHTHTQS